MTSNCVSLFLVFDLAACMIAMFADTNACTCYRRLLCSAEKTLSLYVVLKQLLNVAIGVQHFWLYMHYIVPKA